ncbi:MAG: hypothetical protein H6623_09270 [Bdellovibrionaceae bacterium]|nr:hypothetical protein [Pseudobdellovibrionaceae bacterium]
MRRFFLALLFILFWVPSLTLFRFWQGPSISIEQILILYKIPILQALISAALTLFFGFYVAQGFIFLRQRVSTRRLAFFEYIAMVPSFLPSLFVIISVLSLFSQFPFGLIGVVILHVITMTGFASLMILRTLDTRLGFHGAIAQQLGATPAFFLKKMFPLIFRDLLLLFFILFAYFFTSISIPVIIGGSAMTSGEKLIYDQIFHQQNWSHAVDYFVWQTLLLVPIFIFTQKYPSSDFTQEEPLRLGGSRIFSVGIFLPAGLIFLGLLGRLPQGLHALFSSQEFLADARTIISGSLLLGFICGGLTILWLTLMTFISLQPTSRRWLRYLYISSATFFAFSFYTWKLSGVNSLLLSALVLSLLFSPVLFRLGIYQSVVRLQSQWEMALCLGSHQGFLFSRVIVPQVAHHIAILGGLSAVWGISDFAIARLLLRQDWTLSLWMETLVQQYRWDMALVCSWLLIVLGCVVFLFFWRVADVSRQKFM